MYEKVESYEEIKNTKFNRSIDNTFLQSSDNMTSEIYMECIVESLDSYIYENVVIVDPFKKNESATAAFIVKDGVVLQLIQLG